MADGEKFSSKGKASLFERRKKTAPSPFMPKQTPVLDPSKLGKVGERQRLPALKTPKPPGNFRTLDQDAIAELDKSRERRGLPTLKEPKEQKIAVKAPKTAAISQAASTSQAPSKFTATTPTFIQASAGSQTAATPKAASTSHASNVSQSEAASLLTATSSLQSTNASRSISTPQPAAVASQAAVAATQAATGITSPFVSTTNQPPTVAALTKELSDLSLGTPLLQYEPMLLSCPAYYDKRAYSIHEPISPAEVNMTGVTPRTPQFPSMTWFEEVRQFVANVTSSLANCKFEHPGANRQNGNPFSVLSSNNSNRGVFGKAASASDANPYSLNTEVIVKDLTEERPTWILSSYGPGRDAPEQLWGAPIEQSFEEMRLHYMMGAAAGNPEGALNDVQSLQAQAQQRIQTAAGNPQAAVDFIMQAANNHPNRHDLCRTSTPRTGEFAVGRRPVGISSSQPQNAFAAPSTNGSAFGQPAALGQTPNPFSTGGASGFGRPSALGQSSAFGQPSTLGQPSALSQGSAFGGGGGFGQPSALDQKPGTFGQPPAGGGTSAFGQASALGQAGGSGFGQTSALGAKPNPFGTPAFGQPAQPAQPSGFGMTSALGAKPNVFASGSSAPSASPFGTFGGNSASSTNAPSASPFTAIGGTSNNPSPFTSNAQQSALSPFGQPQQPATTEVSMDSGPAPIANAFAGAGNAASSASPFGQPSQPAANPFGQPAQPAANPFAQASSTTSPFGAPPSQPAVAVAAAGAATGVNPYGPNASRQHPPYNNYASRGPNGQLQAWKGKPIAYKEIDEKPTRGIHNFDNTFTKIWFPDGPPPYYKDTEPDRQYTDAEKAAWQNFVSTGRFQLAAAGGGGMPEAPPMREFCTWDF